MRIQKVIHKKEVIVTNDLLPILKEMLSSPEYQKEDKILRIGYNKNNPLLTQNVRRKIRYFILNNTKAKVYFQCMNTYIDFIRNMTYYNRAKKTQEKTTDPKYSLSAESTDLICISIGDRDDYELTSLYSECIQKHSNRNVENLTIMIKKD